MSSRYRAPAEEEDEEDQDYVSYGTPIEEEGQPAAGSWKRTIQDPTLLKSLPIWKQEPTDEEGRKVVMACIFLPFLRRREFLISKSCFASWPLEHTFVRLRTLSLSLSLSLSHTHTHTRTHMRARTHICKCTHTHTCARAGAHAHTHIHTH